ncbi:MAG: lipase family protein [Polyangiales bacterium]
MHRAFFLVAILLSACSSSSAPPAEAADSGASEPCKTAAPEVGTNPADALRCGAGTHAWLAAADLGDVVNKGVHDHFSSSANAVLLAAGSVKATGDIHDVDLDQIAYRTQDRGKSIEATALVAYPSDLDTRTSFDVLLVLHGTAGFTDACAPSSSGDARPLAAALASIGYVVVAPDYIGLRGLDGPTGFLHPYLAAEPTALASLDAVRAATKHLAKTGGNTCASTRFATVGGSQGGHAALWVDRFAPYYAKELEHVGVVATVPPADMLGEAVRALTNKVPASGNMAAFYGAATDWYGARAKLSEVFVPPLDTQIPTELGASCDPGASFKDKELVDVFAKPLLDAAASGGLRALSPWGCMLVENGLTTTSLPRLAPKAPGYGVLFVLGEADTLVNPEIERVSFDTLCSQGMQMQYLECAGAAHTQATTWALPEIVDFIRDRFAGRAPDAATSCKRAAATKCRATPTK